jgi:RNA recognition motif-containing protein
MMHTNPTTSSYAVPHRPTSTTIEQPNIVFVGNLSYFCEESDLFELFNQYGRVQHVRIVRNDTNTRSLMFGFVTLSSVHEAREMERLLNNHLFMGRSMR